MARLPSEADSQGIESDVAAPLLEPSPKTRLYNFRFLLWRFAQ